MERGLRTTIAFKATRLSGEEYHWLMYPTSFQNNYWLSSSTKYLKLQRKGVYTEKTVALILAAYSILTLYSVALLILTCVALELLVIEPLAIRYEDTIVSKNMQ